MTGDERAAPPPARFFVEGRGFLKRAELTEVSVAVEEDRVSLRIGIPHDALMTAAEAHALAHVLLAASRFLSPPAGPSLQPESDGSE